MKYQYYYRARYYDPKVGRFVTKDPIGFAGGVNLYSYVFNSPVNATDPYGLMSLPSVWKDYEKKAELQKRLDELNKMYEDAVLKCSNGILNECQCNWLYKYLSEEIEKIERQKLSLGFDVAKKVYPYRPSIIPKR